MKYLARYAEPEIALAEQLGVYDHVLCVPACAEPASFFSGLEAPLSERVLVIVVVNGPEHDAEVERVNRQTLGELAQREHCLVIDRATAGKYVPKKQGVGLARKIASDVACAMHAQGKLRSRWIHMTDCDVVLPSDYFAASPDDGVLLTYPFRHVPGGDADVDRAHAIYELFLRYYVSGLRHAGSPYAFQTIGSCLATEVSAYAAVRGVPRRQAAEDFYLVNKMAKLGAVITPDCTPIEIIARRSLRVPFGTGRSTAQIVTDGGRTFYDPITFDLVGAWLRGLEAFAQTGANPRQVALGEIETPDLKHVLSRALDQLDAEASLERAVASAPPRSRARRAHEHFDAFRTRKLVHLARDAGLPELPWREAVTRAPFFAAEQDDVVRNSRIYAPLST